MIQTALASFFLRNTPAEYFPRSMIKSRKGKIIVFSTRFAEYLIDRIKPHLPQGWVADFWTLLRCHDIFSSYEKNGTYSPLIGDEEDLKEIASYFLNYGSNHLEFIRHTAPLLYLNAGVNFINEVIRRSQFAKNENLISWLKDYTFQTKYDDEELSRFLFLITSCYLDFNSISIIERTATTGDAAKKAKEDNLEKEVIDTLTIIISDLQENRADRRDVLDYFWTALRINKNVYAGEDALKEYDKSKWMKGDETVRAATYQKLAQKIRTTTASPLDYQCGAELLKKEYEGKRSVSKSATKADVLYAPTDAVFENSLLLPLFLSNLNSEITSIKARSLILCPSALFMRAWRNKFYDYIAETSNGAIDFVFSDYYYNMVNQYFTEYVDFPGLATEDVRFLEYDEWKEQLENGALKYENVIIFPQRLDKQIRENIEDDDAEDPDNHVRLEYQELIDSLVVCKDVRIYFISVDNSLADEYSLTNVIVRDRRLLIDNMLLLPASIDGTTSSLKSVVRVRLCPDNDNEHMTSIYECRSEIKLSSSLSGLPYIHDSKKSDENIKEFTFLHIKSLETIRLNLDDYFRNSEDSDVLPLRKFIGESAFEERRVRYNKNADFYRYSNELAVWYTSSVSPGEQRGRTSFDFYFKKPSVFFGRGKKISLLATW